MKSFKEYTIKEDTTTAAVVGTGDDPADWASKKKRKKSILTKHYIEINGKLKKQVR